MCVHRVSPVLLKFPIFVVLAKEIMDSDRHLHPRPTFLGLPREIRQQIYENALAPNGYVCFCRWSRHNDESGNVASSRHELSLGHDYHLKYHERPTLQLLATCRQVHEEAIDVVFEMNTIMTGLIVESTKAARQDVHEKRCQMTVLKDKIVIDTPPRVLAKAQKLAVAIDAGRGTKTDAISEISSSMKELKKLSIAMILSVESPSCRSFGPRPFMANLAGQREILKAVLDAAPRTCNISLNPATEAELSCIEEAKAMASNRAGSNGGSVLQVMPTVLGVFARDILLERYKGMSAMS